MTKVVINGYVVKSHSPIGIYVEGKGILLPEEAREAVGINRARRVYEEMERQWRNVTDHAPSMPATNEWTSWYGGECPVPAGTRIRIRLRNSNEYVVSADSRGWENKSAGLDIVAYKVV